MEYSSSLPIIIQEDGVSGFGMNKIIPIRLKVKTTVSIIHIINSSVFIMNAVKKV